MSDIKQRALALYRPPFRYDAMGGYIWDAGNEMVADSRADSGAFLRVRGWGRLQKMDTPEALQDAVGEHIARALTEYWEKNS